MFLRGGLSTNKNKLPYTENHLAEPRRRTLSKTDYTHKIFTGCDTVGSLETSGHFVNDWETKDSAAQRRHRLLRVGQASVQHRGRLVQLSDCAEHSGKCY